MALHPKLIDLSLGRIERLLAALDHPERRLPAVVHVTGTNGKGSVIAVMRACLEAAGSIPVRYGYVTASPQRHVFHRFVLIPVVKVLRTGDPKLIEVGAADR